MEQTWRPKYTMPMIDAETGEPIAVNDSNVAYNIEFARPRIRPQKKETDPLKLAQVGTGRVLFCKTNIYPSLLY
jgi:hypothetical protein